MMIVGLSCKKTVKNIGTPTIIKGVVSDSYRGTKIKNYKISLSKSWSCFKGFKSTTCGEVVATAYTDDNGSYAINFDYNLEEGQSYGISLGEDSPYQFTSELNTTSNFQKGVINIRDVNAWLPVKLKLNLDVRNNSYNYLTIGLSSASSYAFGTDNIFETNTKKTLELRCRPNSDVTIDFWYYENYNKGLGRHLKSIPYKTTLADLTELSLEIDCATF